MKIDLYGQYVAKARRILEIHKITGARTSFLVLILAYIGFRSEHDNVDELDSEAFNNVLDNKTTALTAILLNASQSDSADLDLINYFRRRPARPGTSDSFSKNFLDETQSLIKNGQITNQFVGVDKDSADSDLSNASGRVPSIERKDKNDSITYLTERKTRMKDSLDVGHTIYDYILGATQDSTKTGISKHRSSQAHADIVKSIDSADSKGALDKASEMLEEYYSKSKDGIKKMFN